MRRRLRWRASNGVLRRSLASNRRDDRNTIHPTAAKPQDRHRGFDTSEFSDLFYRLPVVRQVSTYAQG